MHSSSEARRPSASAFCLIEICLPEQEEGCFLLTLGIYVAVEDKATNVFRVYIMTNFLISRDYTIISYVTLQSGENAMVLQQTIALVERAISLAPLNSQYIIEVS